MVKGKGGGGGRMDWLVRVGREVWYGMVWYGMVFSNSMGYNMLWFYERGVC